MKLLLVDDNKMLIKAIGKKISDHFSCEIDLAHSYEQAKELIDLNSNEYFAALLDLCLPDAMHGEVVDYSLNKKLPSIILTGLDDDATRQRFMDKDIIDYVLKEGAECVYYIIDIIERLKRNSDTKIIVAEDSTPMRNLIKNILMAYRFQVFAAAQGAEALAYLEDNPDIKLILTDKEMPAVSGEELIKEVRSKYDKNKLGIIVLTAHGNDEVGARMLKSGANDFIQKPFSRENLICRINNSVDLLYFIEQIQNTSEQLRKSAEEDYLTKLRNRKSFFSLSDIYYSNLANDKEFAILMVDIDKFKSINDNYGHAAGDMAIVKCAKILCECVKGQDIVARFGGEEFCILLKDIKEEDAIKMAVKIRTTMKNSSFACEGNNINFTVSIGVAFGNKNIGIEQIIKNADIALYKAKKDGRDRVETYDDN
ncbi:GGDEF domain-containing response regulator [Campylobacter canadensis]|uniref:GGDEF domain-containing response regulator n=1 Tax=Campylobacter canadensis TaxID=449520 RepID=UPI001CCF9BC9|nr:diguanylate cyclase [Campylobacter canadensis]MBZ7994009.1 diguanylate cyclase [Campylobacter canadensis]